MRSKNTFTLAHFGPQPPVLFASTTGMGENHTQLSDRDCGMPRCFCNHAPRLLHTQCTPHGSYLALFSSLLDPCSQRSPGPFFLDLLQLLHLVLPNCLAIFRRCIIFLLFFNDLMTVLRHSNGKKEEGENTPVINAGLQQSQTYINIYSKAQ